MSLAVLYSFRRCPYAIRARLGLAFAQLHVELREVVLKDKPDALLAVSTKATVPVLVLSCGQVIDESRDILLWALRAHDPHRLLSNEKNFSLMSRLIDQNDNDFKYYLDRYKYADRYPEQTQDFYQQEAERFIALLEEHLEGNRYLFGHQPSFADIAIVPFIRQFSLVDPKRFDGMHYPHLKAWLSSWRKSAIFLSVMSKYKKWEEGAEPVLFKACS